MVFPLDSGYTYIIIEYRATGKSSMRRKLNVIDKAIQQSGTQAHLAFLLSEASGQPIRQSHVSAWRMRGYVPAARIPLFSRVTGIPESDLARTTPHGNTHTRKA